jgi:hypothetical protein
VSRCGRRVPVGFYVCRRGGGRVWAEVVVVKRIECSADYQRSVTLPLAAKLAAARANYAMEDLARTARRADRRTRAFIDAVQRRGSLRVQP